ncbi:PD-(D/E)XK nuclease family protein [Myxococcota bacterium]|nr:PD-(D/E)XK nuclease family protein [Myxococcota bacterium]
MLAPALEGAATGPIGGKGAGVQLLSAVEARGRTFEHLLVLGLSRGELPRAHRGDPLLSEALRQRLGELLPDLATAAGRQAAERDLLSHLVLAAPRVELCWPSTDDEGRVVPPSPLVERLRLACPDLPVERLPAPGSRQDPPTELAQLPRPPQEHALYRAQHADDDDASQACVAWTLGGDAAAQAVAAARAAVRRELDAPPSRLGAGPFLGFVGPVGAAADPRAGALYATTLEAVARCGWQAFLERVLRLEAPPDADGALPGVDARLVGTVVHRVLEHLARQALATGPGGPAPAGLEALEGAPGAPLSWPAAGALEERIGQVAREVALEEGLALPGLWRVLARASGPDLAVARQAEAAEPPQVLAAEHEARVLLPTPLGPRSVSFRADRVDRWQDGLRLTDFKTGRPISTLKKPELRRRDLIKAVSGGTKLQAALYARAREGTSHGRYLFVRADPDLPPDSPARDVLVPPQPSDRDELDRALDHAAGTVIAAWLEGALPPRLVGPDQKTPAACAGCAVRQACLQGDSTARLRQLWWATEAPAGTGVEARARALWSLGTAPSGNETEGGEP